MALWATVVCGAPAFAAGGQPLVLDTQTGISDGQSGIVLQNAPLSRAPMVQARTLPTLGGQPADASPPIIVSPYVEMPGAGGGSQPVRRAQATRSQPKQTPSTTQSSQ